MKKNKREYDYDWLPDFFCEVFGDKVRRGFQSELNKLYGRKVRVNPTTYHVGNTMVFSVETPKGRKSFKVKVVPCKKLSYSNEQ